MYRIRMKYDMLHDQLGGLLEGQELRVSAAQYKSLQEYAEVLEVEPIEDKSEPIYYNTKVAKIELTDADKKPKRTRRVKNAD